MIATFDGIQSSGTVVSHKTGATAQVSPTFASRFQGYIDDLEAAGATIRFMGGFRRGACSSGHQHPCGTALDVCQYGRDVVDARCNLPPRLALVTIAERHGLTEGGRWLNGDRGHAQIEPGGSDRRLAFTYVAPQQGRYGRRRYAALNEPITPQNYQ